MCEVAPTTKTWLHHNRDAEPSAARRMRYLTVVCAMSGARRLRTDVTGGICPMRGLVETGSGLGPCWLFNPALVDVSYHPHQHSPANNGRSTSLPPTSPTVAAAADVGSLYQNRQREMASRQPHVWDFPASGSNSRSSYWTVLVSRCINTPSTE